MYHEKTGATLERIFATHMTLEDLLFLTKSFTQINRKRTNNLLEIIRKECKQAVYKYTGLADKHWKRWPMLA